MPVAPPGRNQAERMSLPQTAEPLGRRLPPARRHLGLVLTFSRVLGSGFAARAGRLYGWSIAIGYGALLAHRAHAEDPDGAVLTLRFVLVSLSLSAGLVAWGAARDVELEERAAGLPSLPLRLGFTEGQCRVARAVGAMAVVARAVLLPGLLATALGLAFAPTPPVAWMGLLLVASVSSYGVLFGVVVGGLARWSAEVSPRHGRGLFTGIVVGPTLLGSGANLVAAFGSVIDRLVALSGTAA